MGESAPLEENLSVARTITARIGTSTLYVTNEVRNDGFEMAQLRRRYPFNIGWPWIDQNVPTRARNKPETQPVRPGRSRPTRGPHR
jgi:hypothetical protein